MFCLHYTDTKKCPRILHGIKLYRQEMCAMTMEEFLEHSQKIKATPVYNIKATYMSLADSEAYIHRWLMYQFPKAKDRKQFITDLYDFMMMTNKKKSVMAFVGEPSSGKTVSLGLITLLLTVSLPK